jgi:alpha-mannosidase
MLPVSEGLLSGSGRMHDLAVHDERVVVRDRLARLLRERLYPATREPVGVLAVSAWHVEGEPVRPAQALQHQDYRPFAVGDRWGPAWGTTWFHLTGQAPGAAGGEPLELWLDLGWTDQWPGFQAEGLVYRPDGTVVKGLSPRNDWIPVAAGELIDLYVEAAANPMVLGPEGFVPTVLGDRDTAGDEPLYRLARADIAVTHTEVWELVQDLEVLQQLAAELPPDQPRAWEISRAIGLALDELDLDDISGTAKAARAALAEVLSRPAYASAHRLSAVGHAHIDTAWLWPQRETIRKVARTVSNVVDLLDRDERFVFAMSSAQQFAWLAEHRPEIFARLADKVRGGRFVPVGGMWVESDTNMPGAEAMARQLIHGKRYFLDTFGVDCPEVWLPDSFGYSAALPQLVRLAGSRWFLTQKISWNTTNPFPHHTFWWEGLDGTRILTHFPPVDSYNSELSGRELAHAERNFRDKGGATRSLVPFGYGDGGGGPTREMLARARRTVNLEGSPRVSIEAPAAFFAEAEAEYGAGAPVWVGELYLELHRATYTSQAKTKQGNRRSEHLLREAELWWTTAAVRDGAEYPYDALDRLWKTVLLHQFHDILPGSSIAWVHREARKTYAAIGRELESLIDTALAKLAGPGTSALAFNASPLAGDGVPALGAAVASSTASPTAHTVSDGDHVLDNGLLRIVVDARGRLVSVWDKAAQREVLAGPANVLQLHPDLPNRWDAWDVESFYRNKVTDIDTVDEMTGLPSGDGVRVVRSFGSSRAVQEISLAPGARRVDMRVEVDWHEREKFLKVAFPVDVHTDRAAYETQYGHIYRPTHENTTWEAAKFEVCAHRWVHLGEPDYGVALANDSTYGHDLRRGTRDGGGSFTTVRLSLLRAPRFPDPDTDQGHHEMRYALVPGASVADAIEAGYRLNLPLRTVHGATQVSPLIAVDAGAGVIVEAVKLADDRSGDVIVRLYEALGRRSRTRVQAGFAVRQVIETDLLERAIPSDALRDSDSSGAEVALRPFQIVTLRFPVA